MPSPIEEQVFLDRQIVVQTWVIQLHCTRVPPPMSNVYPAKLMKIFARTHIVVQTRAIQLRRSSPFSNKYRMPHTFPNWWRCLLRQTDSHSNLSRPTSSDQSLSKEYPILSPINADFCSYRHSRSNLRRSASLEESPSSNEYRIPCQVGGDVCSDRQSHLTWARSKVCPERHSRLTWAF